MLTFIRRGLGAFSLDPATFEEVEADTGATRQALVMVILASIGAGIGNAGVGDGAARPIIFITAASILAWASWAALVYYLGTRVMPEPSTSADLGQLLRTLGFAAAPGTLRAFEVFGNTRWLVLPIASLWMIAAMTIAVRQALDYSSTSRAVGVALLGWAVSVAAAVGVGLLFSVPVS